jgi:TRAP transporter 4TM/12TM fusion protein
MSENITQAAALDEDVRRKTEEYIEADEGAVHKLSGWVAHVLVGLAVAMSLFHLYAAYAIVPTYVLRPVHVAMVMVLAFLLFPISRRFRHRIMLWDLGFVALSIACIAYILIGGEDFGDRATLPERWDIIFGAVFIVILLEATRRSSGWIMPAICVLFLAYAIFGNHLGNPWGHRGYPIARIVGHMYMTLEGIFGFAVDVASSLIILFTIFGAVLKHSGAGEFFIDFSRAAMGGKATGTGRTVVLSSFLLGGPSGSGVATTVTLGSVAYPIMAKSGYGKNAAGGLLAAGGLGAILSPPVLGAAAFLIAEFLKISYLDVIIMATIPTLLFYFGLLVMVEIDVRKYRMREIEITAPPPMLQLLRKTGFHFFSLISIVVLMLMGFSPVLSVFWATVIAAAMSFLDPANALWPRKLITALADGSIGMINVGATCAAAGIIVGTVTLTGLGLKFSTIIIDYAGGSLVLTAIFTSLVVWIVGLAVPVTASYIICAVIAAPAMIKLGVPDYAAHMFIFYYAVLSEVSPPTALSPFAAAAITGGNQYVTTLQSWKYTMPAFLVPFAFVLDPFGGALLLHMDKIDWLQAAIVLFSAFLGIAAMAGAAQGWVLEKTNRLETALLAVGGTLLLIPSLLESIVTAVTGFDIPYERIVALVIVAAAMVLHTMRAGRMKKEA